MKNKIKIIAYCLLAAVLTLGLSLAGQSLLAAWLAPSANPPANNIDEPLNKGSLLQIKSGPLYVNYDNLAATGFSVYGEFNLMDNKLKNCGKLVTDLSGNMICDGPGGPDCGNGLPDAGEQCDDGNNNNGDGCSSGCAWETKVFTCAAKPADTEWNTVSSYIQTCTASSGASCTNWYPPDSATTADTFPTPEACHFVCNSGYGWNGSACVQTWDKTQIDSGNPGTPRSLAIDENGKAHLIYNNAGVWYATNASGSWVKTRVGNDDTARGMSLALDSAGRPRVSYVSSNKFIKYAMLESGTWSVDQAAICASSCSNTSIAAGPDDSINIVYEDFSNASPPYSASLVHVTGSPGLWNKTVIHPGFLNRAAVAIATDLAVDGNGKLHLAYLQANSLNYATNISGDWSYETVEAGDYGGNTSRIDYPAIAVDSSGKVHLAYRLSSPQALKYATYSGGVWNKQNLESGNDYGNYASLAVDSGGKVHLGHYFGGTAYDLKYVTNVSGSWIKSAIDTVGNVGRYVSIAAEASGKVNIVYQDAGNNVIRYITR